MTDKSTILVEQNPNDGTWEVGERDDYAGFVPRFCGFATRAEAEAQIPGYREWVEREEKAFMEEMEVKERAENEQWPDLGYVRAQIEKLGSSAKAQNKLRAFDAADRLSALLNMDLHEHISWPLPPRSVIKKGQEACKIFWRDSNNKKFRDAP